MRFSPFACVFAAAAFVACATKVAEGERPASFTSIDPNLVVADLGAHLPRFCLDAHIFFATAVGKDDERAATCQEQAIVASTRDPSTSCPSAFAACMAGDARFPVKLAPHDFVQCNDNQGAFNVGTNACFATVGEVATCLFEIASFVHQVAQADCDLEKLDRAASAVPCGSAALLHAKGCDPLVAYGAQQISGSF